MQAQVMSRSWGHTSCSPPSVARLVSPASKWRRSSIHASVVSIFGAFSPSQPRFEAEADSSWLRAEERQAGLGESAARRDLAAAARTGRKDPNPRRHDCRPRPCEDVDVVTGDDL
jgi:hypothetical protein